MILKRLFSRNAPSQPTPVAELYGAIVAAARQPRFYRDWTVPDTVDGRFEMIVVHLFLVMDRLKGGNNELRQALTDHFFADMDSNLREMGVGDLSVGKKVRKMAEAYFGRATAYTAAMEKGGGELVDAVARNVFAETSQPEAAGHVADWMMTTAKHLAEQPDSDFNKGLVVFK